MNEYTYDDLIVNPNKEGIESLIGKEVYFYDNPSLCLKAANEKSPVMVGILVEISKDSINPFWVEGKSGIYEYPCIIEKKEEPKPEFIPFTSADEFIEEYDSANYSVSTGTMANRLLNYGGIWLKGKNSDVYHMVTDVWSCGVVIGDINMNTTKIEEGEYLTFNGVMKWKELLEHYTFLDGSPCGKLEENE